MTTRKPKRPSQFEPLSLARWEPGTKPVIILGKSSRDVPSSTGRFMLHAGWLFMYERSGGGWATDTYMGRDELAFSDWSEDDDD